MEVFVSVLGCSLLTYVEATNSQSKEDFISACENAFYYYGGVPQAVVPDNLKAAVSKAGRHESVLNEEFERFAEHYGVTVFPARVRKPKDKALVENAVKLTYKDIYTKLESLHCPDLQSLNAAIRSALELHNNGTLAGRNYSRRTYFEDIERDALGSLNPLRYQVKKQVSATVGKDGYIRLREDAHFYSVPHTYIGRKLTLRYTSSDVEVFDNYTLVTRHTRNRMEFKHTTNPDHLCLAQTSSRKLPKCTKTWNFISVRYWKRNVMRTRRTRPAPASWDWHARWAPCALLPPAVLPPAMAGTASLKYRISLKRKAKS